MAKDDVMRMVRDHDLPRMDARQTKGIGLQCATGLTGCAGRQ
jgi:hypothetical protein